MVCSWHNSLKLTLSLLATDNVGTFSRLRLLSLSCIYIFVRRRKFQFLLGCFLASSFLLCYIRILFNRNKKLDASIAKSKIGTRETNALSVKALAKVVCNKQPVSVRFVILNNLACLAELRVTFCF